MFSLFWIIKYLKGSQNRPYYELAFGCFICGSHSCHDGNCKEQRRSWNWPDFLEHNLSFLLKVSNPRVYFLDVLPVYKSSTLKKGENIYSRFFTNISLKTTCVHLRFAVGSLAVVPSFGVCLPHRANTAKSHLPYLCVDIYINLSLGDMT